MSGKAEDVIRCRVCENLIQGEAVTCPACHAFHHTVCYDRLGHCPNCHCAKAAVPISVGKPFRVAAWRQLLLLVVFFSLGLLVESVLSPSPQSQPTAKGRMGPISPASPFSPPGSLHFAIEHGSADSLFGNAFESLAKCPAQMALPLMLALAEESRVGYTWRNTFVSAANRYDDLLALLISKDQLHVPAPLFAALLSLARTDLLGKEAQLNGMAEFLKTGDPGDRGFFNLMCWTLGDARAVRHLTPHILNSLGDPHCTDDNLLIWLGQIGTPVAVSKMLEQVRSPIEANRVNARNGLVKLFNVGVGESFWGPHSRSQAPKSRFPESEIARTHQTLATWWEQNRARYSPPSGRALDVDCVWPSRASPNESLAVTLVLKNTGAEPLTVQIHLLAEPHWTQGPVRSACQWTCHRVTGPAECDGRRVNLSRALPPRSVTKIRLETRLDAPPGRTIFTLIFSGIGSVSRGLFIGNDRSDERTCSMR